jgi:hypothetical protein
MHPIQPGVASSAQRAGNERNADQAQGDSLAAICCDFATRAP